jgi:hypothetical protein
MEQQMEAAFTAMKEMNVRLNLNIKLKLFYSEA